MSSNRWKFIAAIIPIFGNVALAEFPWSNDDSTTKFAVSVSKGVPPRDIVGNVVTNVGGYRLIPRGARSSYIPSATTTINNYLNNVTIPPSGTFEAWWWVNSASQADEMFSGLHDPNNAGTGGDYDYLSFTQNQGLLQANEIYIFFTHNYPPNAASGQTRGFVVKQSPVSNSWNHLVMIYDGTRTNANNTTDTNSTAVLNGSVVTVTTFASATATSIISNSYTLPCFGVGTYMYQISTTGAFTRGSSSTNGVAFVRILSRKLTVNEAKERYSRGPQ